jgi:hypothetical protein
MARYVTLTNTVTESIMPPGSAVLPTALTLLSANPVNDKRFSE